jgi:arginyl-tRNA synthetase
MKEVPNRKNKPVDHLKNSILGNTVARILKWNGFSTEVFHDIDDSGLRATERVMVI